MGLRELELIDIETEEDTARKAERRRRAGEKRSVEEWPMERWVSEDFSSRKEEWQEEEPEEDDWEEEWEEEWEEDDEEDWETEEHPIVRYPVKGRQKEEYPVKRRVREKRQGKREKEERQAPKGADAREAKKSRKKRRRRARAIRGMITAFTLILAAGLFLGVAWLAVRIYEEMRKTEEVQPVSTVDVQEIGNQDIREWAKFYALELERPELVVDLLTVNEYSRPGEELPEVKSIFVHYTANAGTSAEQNRSYFESLAESHERSASAHFIIGYDGEIIQCIPLEEIAYAVKGRNYDSISIECCYLDENGKFEEETYEALIELTAWLLHKYELRPENVLRHYDEGGKNCPKYYVEHEDAWYKFLMDLENYMTRLVEENEERKSGEAQNL